MWSRRLLYLLALTAALMGQLFDVGYLFHFLFFAAACLPLLGLAGMLLFKHFHHFRNYRACRRGTMAGLALLGVILAVFLLLLWRVVA